jgi:beta-glucanase (GH16 family)
MSLAPFAQKIRSPASVLRPSAIFLILAAATVLPVRAQCDRIPYCELVWSDEFDGSALDTDRWEFQLGNGTSFGLPAGWGNNELQYYQRENASVADGFLTITARQESVSGYNYTSARLRTLGKGDFTFGRMEMRARMPIGKGLWQAFWMLPSDSLYGGWAASGEIDIVEYLGDEPDHVLGTIHYGSPWPNNAFTGSDFRLGEGSFHDDFHVFAIEWEPGEIRWYVDDVHYASQTEWFSSGGPYPAPFDADFHILLNLAVGGNLPGSPDSTTTFPQEFVVDYVRVYQSAAAKGTQAGTASLLFDKPTRLRKVKATLSTSFENQARRRDEPLDARSVWCAARARGRDGAVQAAGKLQLRLAGEVGTRAWRSSALTGTLDERGTATFRSSEIEELVASALGESASISRLSVTFEGSGRTKVTSLDLDCWQRPSR